jgi:hypothetical protein
MRYMMIVKGPENLAEFGPPPAALGDAIGALIEEAMKKGTLVSFGGLKPTATGMRLRVSKGKVVTTDGPFTEAKEVIGGFSIYDFASREEALDEIRRFTELHLLHWPAWEGEIEVRPMYEAADDVRATQVDASRELEQAADGRRPASR